MYNPINWYNIQHCDSSIPIKLWIKEVENNTCSDKTTLMSGTGIQALLLMMMGCKVRCWCIFSAAAFETAKREQGSLRSARPLMAGKTGKLTLTSFPRHVNHWKFAFGKPQLPRFETDSEWCHFSCLLIDFRSSQSILVVILPGHESQYRFEVRYLSRPHNFDPVWSPSLNPRSNLPAWSCHISARSRDRASHNSFHRRPPEMHRFDAMRIKVDGAQKVWSDWKAGSMKDFDKTSNVSYCVFICSWPHTCIQLQKACDLQIDTDRAVQRCQLLCSYTCI